ncbi:KTSC domain-containing protein [Streptodolium elevatio]|uniref:KTSC domain-containing protein n=1 Tax=Streptodolium elevatio TaxID=3157996 RepID=A0ABV3DG23_9ACTN
MRRVRVRSSSLAAVGYDEAGRILEVEYRNGAVYQYFAVPPAVHLALMAAPSLGRHMNAYVKPVFRCRRVRAASA